MLDNTGINAGENQPEDVWFLAGIWADGNTMKIFPKRECKIPAGLPLLVPVLNCEADPIEYPEIESDQEILDHVSSQMHKVVKKIFYVNDEYIPPQRVISDPKIFELYIHPDFDKLTLEDRPELALMDIGCFLNRFLEENTNIQFEGSYEYGRLRSGDHYDIFVI